MSTKTLVMTGLIIGSTLGGYFPSIFGQDVFSVWGIIGTAIGGILGVYLGYKLGDG
jgi:hypothetical protein